MWSLTAGGLVLTTVAACGAPLPKPEPGQSPAAYSGLEVGEDRIEYAIGKVTDIVEEELEKSGVPGASVAVVHGGEVVLAEGFGVRSTETGEAVDAQTVFPMASISAPVSATVVAAESARGEVGWDTPVREYLPWFALSDPRASEQVTVGDMFAHRSGLPEQAGGDLEDLGYDRPAILHGLRHLPLEQFRTSYAYTGFGLTAGAQAVATAAGTPWDELSRELIFEPLGMSESSYSYEELGDRGNRAVGHVRATDTYAGTSSGEAGDDSESGFGPDSGPGSQAGWVPADPARDPDAQAPAGGLSSTAADMAKWMTMVLADGAGPTGQQVVPPEALRQALTPQVVSSPPQSGADRTGGYGYGFDIGTSSSGRVQWSHSGAFTQGAATAMLMMPDLDLGIVTLTNAAPIGVPETINARFADYAQYGDPAQPWGELFATEFAPLRVGIGDLVSARRPESPAAAPPVDDLLGVYRNTYFGDVEVREARGSSDATEDGREDDDDSVAGSTDTGAAAGTGPALVLAVGPDRQTWRLEHWDGATFAISPEGENWPPGSRGSVTFDGDTMAVDLLDGDGMGTFTRVED